MSSHLRLAPLYATPVLLGMATAIITSCGTGRPAVGNLEMGEVSAMAVIEGTASYRERIGLPPSTVFEAVLLDVSIADAPATEIARTTVSQPSAPPIRFSIPFDSTRIDSRRSYSVTARILVDGRLRFTSDRAHSVLTGGAGRAVAILLRMVGSEPRVAPPGGAAESGRLMGGEMVYMADAARFTDCMSGQSYPIAMEGDFVRMQRTYLDRVAAPGSALYVTFEGTVTDRPGIEEGAGDLRAVVVNSFIDAWPNQNCERSRADASLTNTYWRITRLDDQPVSAENGQRQPRLLLRDADGQRSYTGTVGCNQLLGSYTVTGDGIAFTAGATSLMACLPPLDALERRLIDALMRTRRWQIHANTLQFKDEAGTSIALFEAAHL